MPMTTPSLPGTPDYQQLYNEAMQYKKAYFDLLDRYCDMVDKHIAETDREIAAFTSTSLKRPVDGFVRVGGGGFSVVAECK